MFSSYLVELRGAELPRIHWRNQRRGSFEGDPGELLRGDLRRMDEVPEDVARPVAAERARRGASKQGVVLSTDCKTTPRHFHFSKAYMHVHHKKLTH